jgi:hypothetical protein
MEAMEAKTANAADWHFPIVCPRCALTAGTPVNVTRQTVDEAEVAVACGLCSYEWAIVMTLPPVVFKPRPDRRRTPRF